MCSSKTNGWVVILRLRPQVSSAQRNRDTCRQCTCAAGKVAPSRGVALFCCQGGERLTEAVMNKHRRNSLRQPHLVSLGGEGQQRDEAVKQGRAYWRQCTSREGCHAGVSSLTHPQIIAVTFWSNLRVARKCHSLFITGRRQWHVVSASLNKTIWLHVAEQSLFFS